MTKELIIIAAAGWKGSGRNAKAPQGPDICYPLANCPEPFLPIGNGETVLSRLVRQFSDLGFQDFAIGIAEPEYQVANITPWTDELAKYAAQFGEVITIPDLHHHTSWHTTATVFEKCRQGYDAALILFGDYVFSNKFARLVAAMPRPSEILMHQPNKGSTMFWLDTVIGDVFIEKAWRDWDDSLAVRIERSIAMKQALRDAGMPSILLDQFWNCKGFNWRDIDDPTSYKSILRWLASLDE